MMHQTLPLDTYKLNGLELLTSVSLAEPILFDGSLLLYPHAQQIYHNKAMFLKLLSLTPQEFAALSPDPVDLASLPEKTDVQEHKIPPLPRKKRKVEGIVTYLIHSSGLSTAALTRLAKTYW
jgi:hypothetical protein